MKDRLLKTGVAGLCALLISAMFLYASAHGNAEDERARLSAVYQRAFYETCELVGGMQANLKKLSVSGSAAKEIELLSDIARQAQGAQSNLSMLPMGEDTVNASIKFVNQTGDYAQTLTRQIALGGALTADDRAQIALMLESATSFGLQLDQLLADVSEGRAVFSSEGGENGSFDRLSNPAAAYPTLLYDGPFSDGRQNGEMKGLTGSELTAEEAQGEMLRYLGETVQDIVFTGEESGEAACYAFSFLYNGYRVSAGVTRIGGHILYMLPEGNDYGQLLTDEACAQSAVAFLQARGIPDVEVSYARRYEGVLTVNLAPVEKGIVLYPDLIKLQVSMKDGCVVGIEARNYWENHVGRDMPAPALTQAQAVSLASPDLACESARLCVIPVQAGEALCYEVRAASGEDEYLVYIDASTGEERALFQVVQTDEGTLVQ